MAVKFSVAQFRLAKALGVFGNKGIVRIDNKDGRTVIHSMVNGTMLASVDIEQAQGSGGIATVDGKILANYVKSFDSRELLWFESTNTALKCNTKEYGHTSECTFPLKGALTIDAWSFEPTQTIEMSGLEYVRICDSLLHILDKEPHIPALGAVHMDVNDGRIKSVGSNRAQIVECVTDSYTSTTEGAYNVSADILATAKKVTKPNDSVVITTDGALCRIAVASKQDMVTYMFTSRLVEGEYTAPSLEHYTADGFTGCVKVETAALRKVAARMAKLVKSTKELPVIGLTVKDDGVLNVSGKTESLQFHDEISAYGYVKPFKTIHVNSCLLVDVLKTCADETVTLQVNTPTTPVYIERTDGVASVTCPVQLRES